MHIHYVEDNDLDVLNVKSLANLSDNIKITSSKSLVHNSEGPLKKDAADFILLDINRPDSISLADDVSAVRRYSPAPIMFVTGNFADDYRSAAAAAGADGVLEKEGLTLELLLQVFSNAKARSNVVPIFRNEPIEKKQKDSVNTTNLSLLFGYLEQGLKAAKQYNYHRVGEQKNVETLHDTVSALRQLAQEDDCENDSKPVSKRLLTLHEQANSFAASKGVSLTFEMTKSSFAQFGNSSLVELGIKHLLDGIIKAARDGDTVAFRGQEVDGKTEIIISSNRALIIGLDYIFDRRCPEYIKNHNAMFSLSLAAVLLNLRRNQFRLVSSGSVHRIVIRA